MNQPVQGPFDGDAGEDYSVEVLGRTGLMYREAGRELFVDSEVLTGDAGMLLYRESISHWDPPQDHIAIDAEDRERIIGNIRSHFRKQGFEIDVM